MFLRLRPWIGLMLVLALAACNTTTATPTVNSPASSLSVTPVAQPVTNANKYTPSDPALVGNTNHPQVVVFYASWCTSCSAMRPTLFALQDKYSASIDFIYLDIDAANVQPLKDKYGFRNERPTILFLDAQAMEQQRLIGVHKREVVEPILEALLSKEA